MMKIVPAFLVQNSDGIPLRTFTVEADAQCWLNKLSAAVAREHHDDGGEPTERRQTVSRAVFAAHRLSMVHGHGIEPSRSEATKGGRATPSKEGRQMGD